MQPPSLHIIFQEIAHAGARGVDHDAILTRGCTCPM